MYRDLFHFYIVRKFTVAFILFLGVFSLSAPSVRAQGRDFADIISRIRAIRESRMVRVTPHPTWTLRNRPTVFPTGVRERVRMNVRDQSRTVPEDRMHTREDMVTSMINSFQKRLTNYKSFLDKVKSRKDKLAEAGKDVTRLDAFIATATTNLASAETALADAKKELEGLDYSGDGDTIRTTVKDVLSTLREAFTALHTSMGHAVRQIVTVTGAETTRGLRPARIFERQQQNSN